MGDYTDIYTDYVFDYYLEFTSSANNDWISWEEDTNQIKLQAWDYYYDTVFAEQPQEVWVSVKVIPSWNPSSRYSWPGSFRVVWNDRYDEIGTACDLDLTSYVASEEDVCVDGSLIDPGVNELLETQVGAAEAVTFTMPDVTDSGSIANDDATGLTSCGSRTYTLLNGDSFATISGREISVQTTSALDAGD